MLVAVWWTATLSSDRGGRRLSYGGPRSAPITLRAIVIGIIRVPKAHHERRLGLFQGKPEEIQQRTG